MEDTDPTSKPFKTALTTLYKDLAPPRSLMELCMVTLSASIRSKPDWWVKCKDPDMCAKWKAEALATTMVWDMDANNLQSLESAEEELEDPDEGIDDDLKVVLTEAQVEYVLDELDGYAKLRDEQTGMQVSCFDGIWHSDSLVSSEVRQGLLEEVFKLEDVPEEMKDWHPDSDDLVLDLVHPSLYCLVYDHTPVHALIDNDPHTLGPLTTESEPLTTGSVPRDTYSVSTVSKRFQWLPTDFAVSANGDVSALGYINNLHPSHTRLYTLIEQVLTAFIPMFERVLADIRNPLPLRIEDSYVPIEEADRTYPIDDDSDEYWVEHEKYWENFEENQFAILPDVPKEGYTGNLEKRDNIVRLRDRRIQVIIKLANIELTPDEPEYNGGSWHVEGMYNERIVASGIYYYAQENITTSELGFRIAVDEPEPAKRIQANPYDYYCHEKLWGMAYKATGSSELNQCVGAVQTSEHRCVAFPNTLQHRVSPFSLADDTKPGYRKILAFFLVDPNVNIPSTSRVPPQQKSWALEALLHPDPSSRLNKLPPELIEWIADRSEFMTEDEAKKLRLELMRERTSFTHNEGFFQRTFNLCEH